ncbi:2-amino-4-hydroxy-6-hydroxymethyldihydropteridine pyrophosphokinase [Paenibacillus swuensis]|uniref:2-amino-4-hydroxy-6-hydroxymethyldihydropteridine diphosphokinase n=1 Tax=Paenibacillus swuensis TaxID=1178515 RepID=A0A172TGA6_9BACL|nr:2-amino-4-hydroxy-6-hydroxymethyldihydropteridine diphosphokinase [Paenibacillus swuensis]ANE45966.1 2-amino-4-hydroxy-6-hydroxymethyldihydropteridine pyrophosphokinase [Paenibacillus swuensis]
MTAYIGLGSNIGDREAYLKQAIVTLHLQENLEVIRCSSIYETDPVGFVDQASFLNMVIGVNTSLSAVELLRLMLHVEQQLGRTRDVRWGPRTVDLDLLIYDNGTSEDSELTLPHPRMHERQFVLVPLLDVIQEDTTPGLETVQLMASEATGREGIQLWKRTYWHSESGHFVN